MYKLIALDMDGTLLRSDGTISDATLSALAAAETRGVRVVLSTGRPMAGMFLYVPPLSLRGPMITCNGAMVVDGETRKILFERGLARADAARILAAGLAADTTMCVWSQNKLYSNKRGAHLDVYTEISRVTATILSDFSPLLDAGITKILWSDTEARTTAFCNAAPQMELAETTVCPTRPIFLEFFHREVSKGIALANLAATYGISAAETIAIGDERNDVSMLQWAGLGVAMANAVPEALAAADYVTTSNDADGVRLVIERFICS